MLYLARSGPSARPESSPPLRPARAPPPSRRCARRTPPLLSRTVADGGGGDYGNFGGGGYGGGGGGGRAPGICFQFQRGECSYGDRCRFSHDPAAAGGGDAEAKPEGDAAMDAAPAVAE